MSTNSESDYRRSMKSVATSLTLRAILFSTLVVSSVAAVSAAQVISKNNVAVNSETVVKQVTFYPTYGYSTGFSSAGDEPVGDHSAQQWRIPLRIWVSEKPGRLRRIAARGARKIIRKIAQIDELNDQQKDWFRRRSEDFFADSKSGQRVEFVFDNDPLQQRFTVRPAGVDAGQHRTGSDTTDRNGLVEGEVTLSAARVSQLLDVQNAVDGWLSFTAVSGNHSGTGRVRMIAPVGLSVVSDVDDTIKVTEIPAGDAVVMRNTFFSGFRAAPCMAAMYQTFAASTAFHYVSGGPWQMYAPLAEFLFDDAIGFPIGSMHMKNVRTNPFESESYDDFRRLVGGSGPATVAQKTRQIKTLLEHFPSREFILIGDSGESDPEIFRNLKALYPTQIIDIRIRDVVNAAVYEPQRLAGTTVIKVNEGCGR